MMRKILLGLMAACLLGLLPAGPVAAQSRSEGIAAVVNEDAISASDLNDRLKLVIASAGMPDSADIREKLTPQILNLLIDEKLKLQEAARDNIEIPAQEIEEGFAQIAGQNNMTPDQFTAMLARGGVAKSSLTDQIRSQIGWSKVVQAKIRPQIVVADNEVDAVIERLKNNIGKEEYRVSEIFLPVENPGQEDDVKKLADKLVRQLGEGQVPFSRLASQFSQAAGASKGGDLGWVQQGQLPEQLDDVLAQMKDNEVSQPIRSLAGYHILMLRGKRMISAETIPSADEVMQKLGYERLDRMQRSLLLDLKAQAFIEQRV